MKTKESFSVANRFKSLRFAVSGLRAAFQSEHNLRIHLTASILVTIAALYFQVSSAEAAILCMATGFVWAAELINTAIEKTADFIFPGKHPAIRLIKDIAAAAVLTASVTALLVACFIFIPKL